MLSNNYYEPKKDSSYESINFEAAPGYKFIVVKFTALITCMIAWLTGEGWRQNALKKGEDLYTNLASRISEHFTPSTDINLQDFLEKTDLELCFDDYPIHMLEEQGMPREETYDFWDAWKKANPAICEFRNGFGTAASYDRFVDMYCSPLCFTYHQEDDRHLQLASDRTILFRNTESDYDGFNIPYLIYTRFSSDDRGYRGASGGDVLKMVVNAYATDLLTSVMLFFITRGHFRIVSCYQDTIVMDVPDHISVDTVRETLSNEALPMWAYGLKLNFDLSEVSIIKEENSNNTVQQEPPVS